MLASCSVRALALSLLALAVVPVASRAGEITAGSQCSGGAIAVDWTYYNPGHPEGPPEWVGYDVTRRSLADCSTPVVVNPDIVPRGPGTHSRSFLDTQIEDHTLYEYRIIPVDVNRQPVFLGAAFCEPPCWRPTWASCPDQSVPLTVGELQDWGWALYVQPCAENCYSGFYFSGPLADTLRPHAGTGEVFRFFGAAFCCSVEGPFIEVSRYESAGCTPVAVQRPSWGVLKLLYR